MEQRSYSGAEGKEQQWRWRRFPSRAVQRGFRMEPKTSMRGRNRAIKKRQREREGEREHWEQEEKEWELVRKEAERNKESKREKEWKTVRDKSQRRSRNQ
ncbi:hypothetical protein L6164_023264 [Bauhinia variegata]|uniref:Uncharacterized protein n=1 Tax=Bauhinia variegata TaxID=167791 RepID=A0ACB9MI45_BAUVA|nr:hypothetical protein L6164_023264 [Bauhinia variegata]